ncbi:hypothetical protein, partial [Klebsiella pneumoniae]|uniref:hypothetical protein n=1 Tax=Klebsiella pneumoniae TaxID=573 RepID=UPI003CFFEBF7
EERGTTLTAPIQGAPVSMPSLACALNSIHTLRQVVDVAKGMTMRWVFSAATGRTNASGVSEPLHRALAVSLDPDGGRSRSKPKA